MRSTVFQRILDKTPEDIKIFTRHYSDLVVRINFLLKEKGYSQKDLAEKLDKKPSEISKWLKGDHNFTLRSLAKLEAELGAPLFYVPKTKSFISDGGSKTSFTIYNNIQLKSSIDYSKFEEKKIKQSNNYANVS
ncbi:MAG: helix-turn-helix domain-containing protein [Cyclobacteriaceae bacterium]